MSEAIKVGDLPAYTKSEEMANMVTHILGSAMSIAIIALTAVFAAFHKNVLGIITGVLFGCSMLFVYTVSSIYHGLSPIKATTAKKVMRVLDHCDIYWLIAGTYLPIALCNLRIIHPIIAWTSLGIVLGVCIIGTVFTAIDMSKFAVLSYACYFVAGWSVLLSIKFIYDAYGIHFILLLLIGGIVYTLGMIFFALLKKYKFCHTIFHVFIIGGSVIHFLGIFKYVI